MGRQFLLLGIALTLRYLATDKTQSSLVIISEAQNTISGIIPWAAIITIWGEIQAPESENEGRWLKNFGKVLLSAALGRANYQVGFKGKILIGAFPRPKHFACFHKSHDCCRPFFLLGVGWNPPLWFSLHGLGGVPQHSGMYPPC
ncbi:hypothetical protein TNIN_120791 [Trichonephila inaurata madagascariensis]|uniref:Uncharacterized protein n=1 Tax=Trichonephila inaurata madagascariensis TaxID=2747483 RepID=A0A8X6M5V5_9ARAC|nr:hypothetical protein TNIN_120791 [Trichonephila inaurata madagascariensis]